jgi:hypothetical protein
MMEKKLMKNLAFSMDVFYAKHVEKCIFVLDPNLHGKMIAGRQKGFSRALTHDSVMITTGCRNAE